MSQKTVPPHPNRQGKGFTPYGETKSCFILVCNKLFVHDMILFSIYLVSLLVYNHYCHSDPPTASNYLPHPPVVLSLSCASMLSSGIKTSDGCRLEDCVCNNPLHAKPHPPATERGATVKKKRSALDSGGTFKRLFDGGTVMWSHCILPGGEDLDVAIGGRRNVRGWGVGGDETHRTERARDAVPQQCQRGGLPLFILPIHSSIAALIARRCVTV